MPKKKSHTWGIFCLESGNWFGDLRHSSSAEPLLQLLSQWDPYYVPYIHRDVGTSDDLMNYLMQWLTSQYQGYPILYLGFHGEAGELRMDAGSKKLRVDLDLLEDCLRNRCAGRVIYLGSCGTLNVHGRRLRRFLQNTQALALCGYKEQVDWMWASLLELMVLSHMQQHMLSKYGLHAVRSKVTKVSPFLVRTLGFRMIIRA